MVPAVPKVGAISDLIEACDGFVFTGGRPNVHPSHYGHEPTEKHGAFDPDRDAVTLPLIRECVARGVPVFGICRGFQEFNVAFGGTLHPEIREIPGRMNHRMPPDGTLEEKFEHRHIVSLTDGGGFHRVLGAREVMVNSLHGQGILDRGGADRHRGLRARRHAGGDRRRRRARLRDGGAVASGVERRQRPGVAAALPGLRRRGLGPRAPLTAPSPERGAAGRLPAPPAVPAPAEPGGPPAPASAAAPSRRAGSAASAGRQRNRPARGARRHLRRLHRLSTGCVAMRPAGQDPRPRVFIQA